MKNILAAAAVGAALAESTPFGKYRLVALLGRGGMGEVWRAFDTETDRIVALKLLPAHLADDETFQKRFRREARAAAGLYEPHVVPIHGYGEIDGRLYVDMRLIVGRDLEAAVLREGPLDPARAVMIVEQIASALHAAHEIGLLHRDVKPSNILLTDADFAYLIDFGIARVAGQTGLTSTGFTPGTWAYMAPERFGMGEADHRSDVYSLACVLHQCLTGQLPFPGQSVEQQVAGHLTTPPPRTSAINSGVPQAFDDVIAKGMAKNPDGRYTTTGELAQAAQAALMGSRPPTPHPTPVSAAAPITQSAEPQAEVAITGSNSPATSDSSAGTSSVDAAPQGSGAERVPSHPAPEVANEPAAEPRTQAGPTVSASDAPTQQAPISASDDRIPILRLPTFARPPVQEPGSQRLNRRTPLLLGVVAILIVVSVAVVAMFSGSRSSPGGGGDVVGVADRVTVGVKFDQPGLGLKNPDGTVSGFDVDVAKYVAKQLGYNEDQIEWKESPSGQRETLIQNDQVDYIVATYSITDSRKEKVDFAGPYLITGQSLLVRADNTDIVGASSLQNNKKLCSVTGSTPAQRIKDVYAGVQLQQYDTYSACIEALKNGAVDAVTTDEVILAGYAAQTPGAFKIVGQPFSEERYGIGLKKGDTELQTKINDAIEKMVSDGAWKEAFDKNLGPAGITAPTPPPVDRY